MNSHNHPEKLLDLSLKRSLQNWVVRKNTPGYVRDQLLAAAAQQEVSKPRPKASKFNIGWSLFLQSNLSDVAVRSLYGYALGAISFKTSMAMAIR